MDGVKILRKNERNIIEEDWGKLIWYASRELDNSEEMTVGKCILNPGQSNPRHYHTNCEETLFVEKGKISHSIGDESVILNEGDTITVPVEVMHNAKNMTDEEAVLLISFSDGNRETIGE